jgi:hypothetical protein
MGGERTAGRNQALFREVNERIAEVGDRVELDEAEFLCECADQECVTMVQLTRAQYEDVRASDPAHFFVAPGHQLPEIEDVVADRGHFLIVRKRGEANEVAVATDPRSDEPDL